MQRALQLRACLQKVVIALHVFLGLLRRGRAHSLAVPGEEWLDSEPVRPSHPTPPRIHFTTSTDQIPAEAPLQFRACELLKSPWAGASASANSSSTDSPEETLSGNIYCMANSLLQLVSTAISHLSLQKPHTHIREGQRGWGPVPKVNRIKRVSCPQCWRSALLKHTTHTPSGCKLLWDRVRQICIAVRLRLLTLRQLPPHWLTPLWSLDPAHCWSPPSSLVGFPS